jgi:uncharacterized membrane protein HdeD (DUF308 family)
MNAVVGAIAFMCGAAALAALLHRVWWRKIWPSVAAALSLATVTVIGDYVANDELNAFAVPIFLALFAMAFGASMLVEFRIWRNRQSEHIEV